MRTYLIIMIFFAAVVSAESRLPEYGNTEEVDVIKTSQSSTSTTGTKTGWMGQKRCIVINKTRERFCNANAQKWCDDHAGAKECRRFENRSVKAP